MDTKIIKPVIIYAEATPNPASIKFVANIILVENGATAQYLSADDTKGSPLAAKLFAFPFISGIFMTSNFITITKSDAISWDDITQELRDFLTKYIGEGNSIIDTLPTTQMPVDNTFEEKKASFTQHSSPNTEIEVKIIEVLEEHIRPAVENDGGAITFTSFIDGIVTVELRGACSGCPSATFTLKAGIEALLQRLIPEVKEVVAKEM